MASKTRRRAGAHVNLLLTAELQQKIAALAQQHHFTVSNMIRVMVLDYLERGTIEALDRIRGDMEIVWARFSNRLTRLGLEEEIIDALATAQSLDDVARVRGLARASQSLRDVSEQRERRLLAERSLAEKSAS
jgi:hypothetical protein